MWDAIVTWWKSHTITTHSLMIAVATLTTLYTAVPAFKTLVDNVYAAMPGNLHTIIAAAIGIIGYYSLANRKKS
jgi:hypothetical protein